MEHLLQVNLVLVLEGNRVVPLQGTDTQDAASDGHSFLCWMMRNAVWALILVATAVVLVSAVRVLVTFIAKVSVSSASELCQVATVVAFELNVAETVLVANKLLANFHVCQATALAHELLLFHFILLSSHLLYKHFVLAVDVASEEWVVAS